MEDLVTEFLLRRLRRPHVAGGRRDLDVVIVEGGWYRDVIELLNHIDVDGGASRVSENGTSRKP